MKPVFSQLGQHTAEPAISWLMKMTLDHPKLISLAAGFTDNESLPLLETREVFEDLFSSPKKARAALQYGTTAGDIRLRELTAARLCQLDGASAQSVDYPADRILITNGSQQLLYMITEALCDPGDIVLVEDPTYFVYLGIAQSHQLRCRGLRLLEDGLDLQQLENVLEALQKSGDLTRVKFLYLVSYYQNPTGLTTSFEKKAAALKLLARFEKTAGHPIFLLEDAAYRELRFSGEAERSALAVEGSSERVIYAGTYSKPFATGARVGFGLLPEPVFNVVKRIKGNHDFGTANLLQQLLSRALESNIYEHHLKRLEQRYAKKAQVMVKALQEHFPSSVRWQEPRGGLYVWAQLPRKLKSGVKSKLFADALKHDVLYVPGELCYADDPSRSKPNHEMRLSFGGAAVRDIETGIARLGAVLTDHLG